MGIPCALCYGEPTQCLAGYQGTSLLGKVRPFFIRTNAGGVGCALERRRYQFLDLIHRP